MMKKILAVAIVSAFAAPAFAATANVDVYGVFGMSIDSLSNGSSRGTNVSSNASRIGFKGAEELGGGLNAIWQVETEIGADGAGAGAFTAMRDTFVGVRSKDAGTVRLGFMDTPTKQLSRRLDLFNNQIGDTRNLLRSNAISGANSVVAGSTCIDTAGVTSLSGAASTAATCGGGSNAFEERFRNGIRYDTPSLGGFTASLQYSTQTNTGVDTNNDRDAYSLGANYTNGPLLVGATYQRTNLVPGTAASGQSEGKETNWRVGVGYKIADLRLTALYSDTTDGNGVSGNDRKIWGLGAGFKLGNGEIKGQYYKADDSDAVSHTGATMYAIGYDYNLSKRTQVYAAYAKTKNDSGAQFSASGGGGHGDNVGVARAGSNPSGISLGVVHSF